MSKKSSLALLVLVLAAMCLPMVSVYAWQKMQSAPNEEASKIATDFIRVSPTYIFDGIEGSMNVSSTVLAQTFAPPSFWIVTVEFDCRYSGYGDRTQQMAHESIQHHIAVVHVTGGLVTAAVIDGVWDELNCVML
jgi:hypothetical protein